MAYISSDFMIKGFYDFIDENLTDNYDITLYDDNTNRLSLYIYEPDVLKNILKEFKFKDVGSYVDYPEYFPQETVYTESDIPSDYDMYKRIAISEKLNAAVIYTSTSYRSIHCLFIIDKNKFSKFIKKSKPYLQFEDSVNMFSSFDFKPESKNEYFDIAPTKKRVEGRSVDVIKRKVKDENLVFDKTSQLYAVMTDIEMFFTKETKKMYKTIDVAYKRGIIIYGDPGNGKSAMIREMIRILPKRIIKIIINPSTRNVTEVLSALVGKLDGSEAIIVIEDIDSLITDYNRSEFLNILDGIDTKSGIYFIGTTNYPDKIDPAFMNRSGRFDRTYEIGNPTEIVRKEYFKSHNVKEILKEFKLTNDKNSKLNIIDMFVECSDGMSMASLKELILLTKTELVKDLNNNKTIEDAVKIASKILNESKAKHIESHNKYKNSRRPIRFNSNYNEDVMYEEDNDDEDYND